ncbi:hypothetical protein [Epilithonimonas vandammei]|uniref:hypothetical protein n=1 Tax=Epilithonimonas vandammei TaxID=2487072 RepID=UPI0028B12A0B|nr:hypothetical protein [Epilithonimonas vandammei]
MSSLDYIGQILHSAKLFTDQLHVIEQNKDSKGKLFEMKFKITVQRGIDYKLYRFEDKDFPFFEDVSGLKKMCDFVLFCEEKNHLHVLVIELKLGPESAKKQLDSAEEFVKFLINSCKRTGKKIENFTIKKIRICQDKVNKRVKMANENNFEFDENNYLDYKLKTIYLEPLIRF